MKDNIITGIVKNTETAETTDMGPDDMKEHSIIWFPMAPSVGFLAAVGATKKTHLPLFLSGKDLDAFKQTGAVNFNPVTLLYGILYGASDDPPTLDVSLSSRYFNKALELLASELKMPDVEQLILTASADARQEFGSDVSARMLENGLRFIPRSDKIRSDFVVDLWIAAEERSEPDHIAVLREIVSLMKQIDIASLAPPFRNCLSYIATVAFAETDPSAEADFIRTNFRAEDLDWIPKEKKQIADYRQSRRFSWRALSIQ